MFTDVDTGKSLASWARTRGVNLRIGAISVSIELRVPGTDLIDEVSDLYAYYPQENPDSLPDFAIALRPPNVWRGLFQPQIQAYLNGSALLQPMHRRLGVPMLESSINWAMTDTTRALLLHAGVVERNGRAVLLPGESGAGKSTLCISLISRGWRLLSDEMALIRPEDGQIQPHPRPISLKNAAIDVITKMMPNAYFSKRYEGTSKGTVVFMRAPNEAIQKADEAARPILVIFPKYDPDARTELKPLEKAQAFMRLIEHSPNYFTMLGSGFETLANLVEACDHYTLSYPALDQAISAIESVYSVPQRIEHVE